jgi:Concanavalin A-like lectin/glucanases superfamily
MSIVVRLVCLFVLLWGSLATAATRIGVQVTQEEVNCWRQRAGIDAQGVNGITCPVKYKSAGDVSTNSPGDWDHIVQQKNAFMANLSNTSPPYYWSGPPNVGRCYTPDDPYYAGGSSWDPVLGDPVMDAAFYSLVANDATVRTAVRNNLVNSSAEPTLDFTNGTLWCPATANDVGMHWGYSLWMLKLIHAYDYIRMALSTPDKTTLDAWFLGYANFGAAWTSRQAGDVWVDADNGNYTLTSGGSWQCSDSPRVAYFNGPVIYAGTGTIINRKSHTHEVAGLIGVMLNNASLKNKAKHRFEEYLKFGVFPQGAAMDFERWSDGPATQGWRYAGGALQSYAGIADAFGRDGDLSFVNFQTTGTETMCTNNGTTAGVKSLGSWIAQYVSYVQQPGAFTRYGTNNAANQIPAYIIASVDGTDGQGSVRDIYSIMPNLYYQNATVKSTYLRQAANTPAYPANPEGGGYNPWGGAGGVYPGILFMFGQMEGVVNPYSVAASTAPTVTITAPTSASTYTTATTPLTPSLAGTATDDVGVLSVTWACPTCTPTSGTATCASCGAAGASVSWSVATIGLAVGDNVITVTATDADTQTATDVLTVTRTGQIACYSFDNVATDSTGRGHTMTLTNGATYATGQVNQALSLDGVNDYASTPTATDLNLTGDMTVDFFANLVGVGNNVHLVSKEDLSAPNATPYHVKINNAGTPNYQFYQHNAGDFSTILNFTSFTVPTNTWHHVAITRNMTTGQITLWINGVSTQTLTGWTDPPGGNTIPLTLGSNTVQGAGSFLSGRMDELCLANYVLSTAEIQARAARATVAVAAPTLLRLVK